jgi:hypothetical protein
MNSPASMECLKVVKEAMRQIYNYNTGNRIGVYRALTRSEVYACLHIQSKSQVECVQGSVGFGDGLGPKYSDYSSLYNHC